MIQSKLTAFKGGASLVARTREGQLGALRSGEPHTAQGRSVEGWWVVLLVACWAKVRAQGPQLGLGTGLEALRRLEATVMLAG